jgi:hypothetical protein
MYSIQLSACLLSLCSVSALIFFLFRLVRQSAASRSVFVAASLASTSPFSQLVFSQTAPNARRQQHAPTSIDGDIQLICQSFDPPFT